ncbi:hypothetical protein ACFSCX_24910 [Bacillus salitolerans]|uniref:YCII-related domain-containing protein n=1 Tax=Bacillus salitolerans TaxID=1437434 RepID=A0ABW4LX18_9BACI
MKFVVHYTCGEGWIKGKPFWEQGLVPHREYLVEYLGEKLVAGGPFQDNSGGLVIIETEKIEDIEEIIENDPAVIQKKFVASIYPWVPVRGIFN